MILDQNLKIISNICNKLRFKSRKNCKIKRKVFIINYFLDIEDFYMK